jgi:hypothetical protein
MGTVCHGGCPYNGQAVPTLSTPRGAPMQSLPPSSTSSRRLDENRLQQWERVWNAGNGHLPDQQANFAAYPADRDTARQAASAKSVVSGLTSATAPSFGN